MIGAAALVPPSTIHAEVVSELGPYTATPVLGSATAATSATMRVVHPVSCCQLGFGSVALQPLLEPPHAVSVQPRRLAAVASVVPPTAVMFGDDDGNSRPVP